MHCGSKIALFTNIFYKLYLVQYIYKNNILREVYTPHCGSKISLFVNIFCKLHFVKYIIRGIH